MAKLIYDYWFVQFDFPITAAQAQAMGKPELEGKPYKSSGGKMVYNEELKREIPVGWETEKIEGLGTIVGGSTPSKAVEENFTQKGIPWITPKDLSKNIGNKFITKGELDVSDKGLKEASLNILPSKSVLMSSRAPIGYVAINRVDCTTNQGFKSIICNKEYSCEYVFHVLKHYMPLIEANASGSTFREISSSVLKSINITRPNKQVVEEFSKRVKPFFEKQDNLEQQNQELSALRDWLLPMLMNGQVRVGELSDQVSENDNSKEENLSMAAEPQSVYGKAAPLNIPENKKGFAKQVLAGKIVSEFKDDPAFTNIKFQKIQFLAEHIIEADLNLNYYYQAAGPYDNRFMHTIHNDFRKQKWFDCRNMQFNPLEKQEKIEGYYQGYFSPAQKKLDQLFELLYHKSEAEAEIIATLYAVWNNRIIEERSTSNEELLEDFYKWSDRKQQYMEEQVLVGLKWLRTHQMEPKGFGKLIKKAKGKS
jgi:type I restriction enzyme S subunit